MENLGFPRENLGFPMWNLGFPMALKLETFYYKNITKIEFFGYFGILDPLFNSKINEICVFGVSKGKIGVSNRKFGKIGASNKKSGKS